jgi:hypothetical protein
VDGIQKDEKFGELSFTRYGLTGPITLSISREVVIALDNGSDIAICIDLKPGLDSKKLAKRLQREFDQGGKSTLRMILNHLLPRDLIPVCLHETGIPPERKGYQINSSEKAKLLSWLKKFKIPISGHRPFSEAIITSGGIDTTEINQKTMASKLIKGLFFAGEVLDLDGPTGGFNLQIAFSTGRIAGESACYSL